MEGTKTDIDESGKLIDQLDGVESSVHAAYYGVSADYYKVRRTSKHSEKLRTLIRDARRKQNTFRTIKTRCFT